MNKKLISAMMAYAAIAVLAAFTLDGGLLRNGVWVLMAGLAIKTYVAHRAGWELSADKERSAAAEKAAESEAPPRP